MSVNPNDPLPRGQQNPLPRGQQNPLPRGQQNAPDNRLPDNRSSGRPHKEPPPGIYPNDDENLLNSDREILINLGIQVITMSAILIFYFIFRKKAPWLYYPNSRLNKNHPGYHQENILNWIKPIITIKDTNLLSLIGLDGFMFLQTIKLLYRICFIFAIVVTPILSYLYFTNSNGTDASDGNVITNDYFIRFSLKNVNSRYVHIYIILFSYIMTLTIFYLIYIYYKRYIVLRQIYLASPASMTSIIKLKELSARISPETPVLEFIDVQTRTVLVSRLPNGIHTDEECKNYIEELGMGEVEKAVLVKDTRWLQELYEERNNMIQNLEKEINWTFDKMRGYYEKNREEMFLSFKESDKKTLEESAIAFSLSQRAVDAVNVDGKDNRECDTNDKKEKEGDANDKKEKEGDANDKKEKEGDANGKENNKSDANGKENNKSENNDVINHNINNNDVTNTQNNNTNTDALSDSLLDSDEKRNLYSIFINSKSKFFRKRKKHTWIEIYLKKIEDFTAKIDNEQNRLKEKYQNVSEHSVIDVDNSLFQRADRNDVSFFSWKHVVNFHKNRKMFTLDLPINKKIGFVTFRNRKDAAVMLQAKIGTKVFSCKARQAPAPDDVIWKNMTRNEIFCYVAQFISFCFYIAIYGGFFYLVTFINEMLDPKKNQGNFFIDLISKSDFALSVYTGSFAPLVYNVLLFFIQVIISVLINMEGTISYSSSQVRTMYVNSLFLFFNGFVVAVFTTTLYESVSSFIKGESSLSKILHIFSNQIINSTKLFFNTIIQRLCVGTALIIIKPGPFIMNFILAPIFYKTRRQKMELHFSPPMDYGNAIPSILLIFPIVLTYSFIMPLMFILGLLFYIVTYLAYKNELLYASKSMYESGGIYWIWTVKFILYSILSFHFVSILLVGYICRSYFLTCSLIPLTIISYMYYTDLCSMMENSCLAYPINEKEETYLEDFSENAREERNEMLKNWKNDPMKTDLDVMKIGGINKSIYKNLYSDPAICMTFTEVVLPRNFYFMMRYLRARDDDNVFGFSSFVVGE